MQLLQRELVGIHNVKFQKVTMRRSNDNKAEFPYNISILNSFAQAKVTFLSAKIVAFPARTVLFISRPSAFPIAYI